MKCGEDPKTGGYFVGLGNGVSKTVPAQRPATSANLNHQGNSMHSGGFNQGNSAQMESEPAPGPQPPVGPVEPRVGSRAEAGLREAVEGVGAAHGRETTGLSGQKVPHAVRPGSTSRVRGAPTGGKSDPADDAHPAASPFQPG